MAAALLITGIILEAHIPIPLARYKKEVQIWLLLSLLCNTRLRNEP